MEKKIGYNKEYHWYNYIPKGDVTKELALTLKATRARISHGDSIIHTLQSYFITADLIKSGFTIYLHFNSTKAPIKVDMNSMIGSERIKTMKSQKSVEKWILEELLVGKI